MSNWWGGLKGRVKSAFNWKSKSLSMRFSTAADLKKVVGFYTANKHDDVDMREMAKTEKAVKDGRFLLMLDRSSGLYGGSAGYDYAAYGADNFWTEFGTTRTKQDGLGVPKNEMVPHNILYPYIVASQVVYEFLTRPPQDRFFANIYENNTAVMYLLKDLVGWKDFAAEQKLVDMVAEFDNPDCDKAYVWLGCSSDTLPRQARLVMKLLETKELAYKKADGTVKLDLSKFPLANEWRPYVEALASGEFSEMLESNPHVGLAETRKLLESYVHQGIKPMVGQNSVKPAPKP